MEMEKQILDEQADVTIETEKQAEPQQLPIGVYVKVNEKGYITDVNSDVFIKNLVGWLKIDEGYGDKFAHAQSNYFDMNLVDEVGDYQIKYFEK